MFTSGERKGLVVLVTISGLSLVSTCFLLSRLRLRGHTIRPIGLFYILLLLWQVIQAIALIMSVRWLYRGHIEPGKYCLAQAILNYLNSEGTALATTGLSWCILHNYVFQAREIPLRRAVIVAAAMLILQILIVLIPNLVVGVHKLNGPSGFWCWIPVGRYYALKIVTVYLFYWTAVASSSLAALAYLASAYVDRRLLSGYFWIGIPTRQNGLLRIGIFSELALDERELIFGFNFDISLFGRTISMIFVQYLAPPPQQLMPLDPVVRAPVADDASSNSAIPPLQQNGESIPVNAHQPIRDALKLLSFPLSYAVLVIPLSVVRFWTFRGHVGAGGTLFVGALFALDGLVQAFLFICLEPDFGFRMSPMFWARRQVDNPPTPPGSVRHL